MQLCTRLMTFHGSHGTQLTDEVPKAYRRSRSGDKRHLTRSTLQKPRGVQSGMATSSAGHAGGDRSNFGCHNVACAQPTSKDQIANQQAGDVSTVKEFVMRQDLPCMICTAAVAQNQRLPPAHQRKPHHHRRKLHQAASGSPLSAISPAPSAFSDGAMAEFRRVLM